MFSVIINQLKHVEVCYASHLEGIEYLLFGQNSQVSILNVSLFK